MVPLSERSRITALVALARRLGAGLVTALAAVSLTFFALRLAAGDPVASLLSQGLTTPAQAEAIRRSLGYDLPLLQQYLHFLTNLTRGDLGVSLYSGQPVAAILSSQLASTLQLATLSLVFALPLGILLGSISSWKTRPTARRIATTLSGLATSLPVATTGVISLLIVSLLARGRVRGIQLWLPALVLGFAAAGPFARAVHSGLESSLSSPFILAAKARGLRRGRRIYWHALRPALPAAIALISLEAAFLFAGTVVTETVFSRPGLGRTLVRSILQADFPVAQGIVALAALTYVGSQMLADGLGWVLDPRLRGSG
ncbi:MAG: ABC transporter permease [Chloroflexi bacterium]|nr:ABC transporter permease [Chloroflexota bacterium]